MSDYTGVRGKVWFHVLTEKNGTETGNPNSVLSAHAKIGGEDALFLCVVRDPESRFPCARDGQVGLEEAYALAARVREALQADRHKPKHQKRPILAIVDVKSQAYGRREETAGIFFAAAVACDAYAAARMAGHPVIALIVGHAFSGGFLTHGYQANRILAFDDAGVMIHAMHKEAAARVTRRSVAELEKLGHEIAPMSYDVRDYAKLGILWRLLHVAKPEEPTADDLRVVKNAVADAIVDTRAGDTGLEVRLQSTEGKSTRKAGLAARAIMEAQWREA